MGTPLLSPLTHRICDTMYDMHFGNNWVGYIISKCWIYDMDVYPFGILDVDSELVDISANGSGYKIFLLHKIFFLATTYRIWIYIHFKSVDLDMIINLIIIIVYNNKKEWI